MRTVLLLSLVTWLFTIPTEAPDGLNVVSRTYDAAAALIWSGESPYSRIAPGADWYKYSPLFAYLYYPLTLLPDSLHVALWLAIGAFVFWSGICRFFQFNRDTPKALWFALLLASMELDASLRYQQVNALLVGMILHAVADVMEGKLFRSAFILTLASNFKVFPVLIAALYLVPPRWRYLGGCLVATLVALGLPAVFGGLEQSWLWHVQWTQLVLADTTNSGILDLGTVLTRDGWIADISPIRWAVGLITLSLVLLHRLFTAYDPMASALTVCTVLLGLLLLNPRTESPTFVLAAPAYLILVQAVHNDIRGWKRWILLFAVLGCASSVTLVHNDLWPRVLFDPTDLRQATKTLGTLGLWVLCCLYFVRQTILRYNRLF